MTEYTKCVTINKKDFFVKNYEFSKINIEQFSNLLILKDVDKYERVTGLLNELSKVISPNTNTSTHACTLLCINATHGGFLAINSSNHFKEVYGICESESHYSNATKNLEKKNISNVFFRNNNNFAETINDI